MEIKTPTTTISEDDFDMVMKSEDGELVFSIELEDTIKIYFTKHDTKRIIDVVKASLSVLENKKGCGGACSCKA